MNDTLCRNFFLQPSQTLHRHYEALRAHFVDHRPLSEIAQAHGYHYGTLRNLVATFRDQCRTGQLPPFSPSRSVDGPAAMARRRSRPHCPPWPTAANSP